MQRNTMNFCDVADTSVEICMLLFGDSGGRFLVYCSEYRAAPSTWEEAEHEGLHAEDIHEFIVQVSKKI